MPRVPTFQARPRARVGGSSSPLNTAKARLRGEALSDFGENIFKTGAKLRQLKEVQDVTERKGVLSDFKTQYQAQLEDLSLEIVNKGSGVDDTQQFEKQARKIENRLLGQFNKQYGNKYARELQTASNGVFGSYRSKVNVQSAEKRTERVGQLIEKTNSQKLAKVTQHPETLEDTLVENTTDLLEIFDAREMSDSPFAKAAIRDNSRALVESAVDGAILKGEYAVAQDIVKSPEFLKFYSQEEQRAINDRIVTQGREYSRYEDYEDDRQRETEERILEARQEENYLSVQARMSEAANAGNFSLVFNLQNEVKEMRQDLALDKTQLTSLTGMSDKILQRQSKYSSYGLSKDFYDLDGEASLGSLKRRVTNLANARKLTPQDAERWEKLIKQASESMSRIDMTEYRTYKDFLETYGTPESILSGIAAISPEGAKKQFQQDKVMLDHFARSVILEGQEPKKAFQRTLNIYRPGTAQIEMHPVLGLPAKSPQQFNQLKQKAKNRYALDPIAADSAKQWLERNRRAIEFELQLERMQDFERTTPDEEYVTQRPDEDDVVDKLFGIDDALSTPDEPDQLPPYLQRREY